MNIKLSSSIGTRSFFLGYGQKEAKPILSRIGKYIWSRLTTAEPEPWKKLGKRLKPAVGSLKDLTTTERGMKYLAGIPAAVGTGTAGASYLTEDPYNPETMEPHSQFPLGRHLYGTHILRGIGAAHAVTDVLSGRWKRKPVKSVLTSGALIATPNVARAVIPKVKKIGEEQRFYDSYLDKILDDRVRSLEDTSSNIEDTSSNIEDTSSNIEDTSSNIEDTTESVNEILEGVKKGTVDLKANLPYIVAGLSVLGLGAYAIHKYISFRLAKAVKDDDDETEGENDMDPRLQAGLELQLDKRAQQEYASSLSGVLSQYFKKEAAELPVVYPEADFVAEQKRNYERDRGLKQGVRPSSDLIDFDKRNQIKRPLGHGGLYGELRHNDSNKDMDGANDFSDVFKYKSGPKWARPSRGRSDYHIRAAYMEEQKKHRERRKPQIEAARKKMTPAGVASDRYNRGEIPLRQYEAEAGSK